jgi:hypothetical protein
VSKPDTQAGRYPGSLVNAPDRLYFRQLLSGRDIARSDPLARQMVNFVYLVGDRETGEAVAVDAAYDVRGILDVAAADGMKITGALVTHYHQDHVSFSPSTRCPSTSRVTRPPGSNG